MRGWRTRASLHVVVDFVVAVLPWYKTSRYHRGEYRKEAAAVHVGLCYARGREEAVESV